MTSKVHPLNTLYSFAVWTSLFFHSLPVCLSFFLPSFKFLSYSSFLGRILLVNILNYSVQASSNTFKWDEIKCCVRLFCILFTHSLLEPGLATTMFSSWLISGIPIRNSSLRTLHCSLETEFFTRLKDYTKQNIVSGKMLM